MFFKNMYSGPGRRSKLTSGLVFFIIILLILQGSIMVCALKMAVKTRVRVVWLDPFLQISIQGADGYAVEYQQSFTIHAEFRAYDKAGTYSSADAKEISVN